MERNFHACLVSSIWILTNNRLDFDDDAAFSELPLLEVLDLSYNAHHFRIAGVTHRLGFIEHLTNLRVLNLSNNDIFTLTETQLKRPLGISFQWEPLDLLWNAQDTVVLANFSKSHQSDPASDDTRNNLQHISSQAFLNLPRTLYRPI